MNQHIEELKRRLLEINDLEAAAAVLSWDQSTYMPPGGAAARGRQLATLGQLAHAKFIDPRIGELLERLQALEADDESNSDDAALVRVTRRDYQRAVSMPPEFVAQLYSHTSASFNAWLAARANDDFASMRPYLEKTLELSRAAANFFPGYTHIADPLIDWTDYGMRAESVRRIFAELREQLVPLVQAITAQPAADDSCLRQQFPEPEQIEFGKGVARRVGYDFERGRQDKSAHPFMIKFSHGDVRITTRVQENNLGDALFSTIHEVGHALYEQGVSREYAGTPLASGTSSGMHESQSRLWENIVGRGRPFWQFFYPQLQATFPKQLNDVPLDVFHRAINKVERSLIRTDADEVTYNLHVIIRFDFELDLLEGRLAVADLPEAWRERYAADLGVTPPDDRSGVMQDIHWFGGLIGGAFQGYTLGNIMSAQIFAAAERAHPDIASQMTRGDFDTLRGWLTSNIYQHGRKWTASELLERSTGSVLTIEPYLRYLRGKFGELYQL